MQMTFDVECKKHQQKFVVALNLIGKHNILNALAAIAVAIELEIDHKIIQAALDNFSGVARRLDYHQKISIKNYAIPLFDDYGHHPNEIAAVLSTLRNTFTANRLVVIFQPHRFSRTRDLFNEFVSCLSRVDILILLDIYPANESPIHQVNSAALADSIRQRSSIDPIVLSNSKEILDVLPNVILAEDVLLTLGAGDVHKIPHELIEHFGHH